MSELDVELAPVSVRLGAEELATLDALVAEWRESRSGVFRRLLLAAPRTPPQPPEAGQLGRVDLLVPIRPESIAWMDARALAWGWDRAQVARLLLSEGRRIVELKHARAAPGAHRLPRERVVAGQPEPAADEPEPAEPVIA